MNKKLLLGILMVFSFAIIMVSAGLITNWFSHTAEFEVTNPISVSGETIFDESATGGDSITGEEFTIANSGSIGVNVQVIDDAVEGITTSYSGVLQLTEKTVDFNLAVWNIPEDAKKVNVKYTIVGDSFETEILNPLSEYSLIYYKDNSDRFNNPAEVILVGDVSGNLPYEIDGNANEYNYCTTGEYDTCQGAKLWYVPTTAINEDSSLDWSRASEFYFESNLIQYNSNGELVIYPNADLIATPKYYFDVLLESGQYTVITEVNPITA